MLKNHPRGLATIFLTEMWERVGFYTLMAVLVLYMDKTLAWPDGRKGEIYGLFLALCYFVPLLGGWLGDRVLGRARTVKIGAVLMALGYVALALSSAARVTPFYAGLLLIGLGTGIFKVNMGVLVGDLYADRPKLKDAGYNIFYMGVNLGAMVAPLLATVAGAVWGSYNISFWICAAGLVIALAIFQAGGRALEAAVCESAGRQAAGQAGSGTAVGEESAGGARPGRGGQSPEETRRRIGTLVTLFFIVILFWVAFYQNGFAMTLFAERSTVSLNWLRPETYQFFEPFFILCLTPILLALFSRLSRRGKEPSTPEKIFLGMLFMSLAMFVMVAASAAGGNGDRNIMSPSWLIGSYFLVTVAEILISPMGQSFVSKVAPPRFRGVLMGGWFAATAAGSYGSGILGKFYSRFPHHQYFLLLTGLLALAAVLVVIFMKRLKRFSATA